MTEQIAQTTETTEQPAIVPNVESPTQETVAATESSTTKETVAPAVASESWMDAIKDEELKTAISKAGFKDVESLAKSFKNLEKKLGSPDRLKDAKSEDKDSPPSEYKLEDYKLDYIEGFEPNEEAVSLAKSKALELGLSPEQYQGLLGSLTEQEYQVAIKRGEEVTARLRQEWGDNYDRNSQKADRVLYTFLDPEMIGIIDDLDPEAKMAVAKLSLKFANGVSENTIGGINQSSFLTKEEAQSKLDSIYSDKDHPYHKGDKTAVSEVFELIKVTTESQV